MSTAQAAADKIKDVSKKEYIPSLVPWHVKSRKLSRILDFFYKNLSGQI